MNKICKLFVKQLIIFCFLWLYSHKSSAECICNNTDVGTLCGHREGMSGCLEDHVYRCDGQNGSEAHLNSSCSYGCISGISEDFCQLGDDCLCLNSCGGRHCGQSILMAGFCLRNHIYECSGEYGSVAHHYGLCIQGCIMSGCSRDYCRI